MPIWERLRGLGERAKFLTVTSNDSNFSSNYTFRRKEGLHFYNFHSKNEFFFRIVK